MTEKLYSIAELAEILKLHPKTLLRFIHENKITAKKIGRSWMVTEEALKTYVHGELAQNKPATGKPVYEDLYQRIHVSAVIEISEHSSEETTRISNTLMAMLNSAGNEEGIRFDCVYYPEIEKAKYLVHGKPEGIRRILQAFEILCAQEGN